MKSEEKYATYIFSLSTFHVFTLRSSGEYRCYTNF